MRALGYPSRELLTAWVQAWRPETRTRLLGRSPELSSAAKQSAVIALCTPQASAQSVTEEIGVRQETLYNWKHQLLGSEPSVPMTRKRESSPSPERHELEQQVEAMRRDTRRLLLEQDILKKANELVKKDLGIDQQLLTNREKTQLVDALRPNYALTEVLGAVGLPRSSFFYHLARLPGTDKYGDVRRTMADIFERNYRCYGHRRLRASLTGQSVNLSD